MAKNEEKAKVGRPKLADSELINNSWEKIFACLSVASVMAICGAGVLTGRTPWQVITFQNPNKVQASVANTNVVKRKNNVRIIDVKDLNNTTIIKAKKTRTRIVKPNGEVTYIISANDANN